MYSLCVFIIIHIFIRITEYVDICRYTYAYVCTCLNVEYCEKIYYNSSVSSNIII